jgi:acyl carrier protein
MNSEKGEQLSEQELLDALRDVLVEKLKVDGTKVQAQANLYDDLGLDSIDLMTAVMAMEERFGIEISDDELEQVTSVGDAVRLLGEKVAANA